MPAAGPTVPAPPSTKPAVPAPTATPAPPATTPAADVSTAPHESKKSRVGLEFAMPETPPPKKTVTEIRDPRFTSRSRSRSSSRQREKRKSPKTSPEKSTVDVRPTGRG